MVHNSSWDEIERTIRSLSPVRERLKLVMMRWLCDVATGRSGDRMSVGVFAALGLVIIVGVILRFGYLLHHQTEFQTEIAAYESNTVSGGNARSFDWTLRLGPLPHLPHGTILWLSRDGLLTTALLEAASAAVVCVPIFLLSNQLYPAVLGSGLTAATVYALHPQAIVYCCLFFDHQAVSALAMIGFVLLAHGWTPTSSRWRAVLCGATLGLLSLSRTIMISGIVYLCGGAFVSISFQPFLYDLIAAGVILNECVYRIVGVEHIKTQLVAPLSPSPS